MSETEAQKLEDEGRLAKKNKQYNIAVMKIRKAALIYRDLGMEGMVGILEKEVQRIIILMDFLGVPLNVSSPLTTDIHNSQEPQKEPVFSASTSEKNQINETDSATIFEKNNVSSTDKNTLRIMLEKKANALESKIKTFSFQDKYDEIIDCYRELEIIYEKLNYQFQLRKISFQIEKYTGLLNQQIRREEKDAQDFEEQKLTIAQQRAQRLQKEHDVREKQDQLKEERFIELQRERAALNAQRQETIQEKIERAKQERLMVFQSSESGHSVEDLQKKQLDRERKERMFREKKEQEDAILKDANSKMDEAKYAFDKHEFEIAKQYYNESADLFQEIGWDQQASILYNEANSMDAKKDEYLENLRKIEERKRKQEEMFEQRAQKILDEKERKRKEEELAKLKLPDDIQLKADRAQMVLKKAEGLYSKGKLELAYARFEYLIDLYLELADYGFDKKIPEIESKLEELKPKINL